MARLNQLSLVTSTVARVFDRLPEDWFVLTRWLVDTNEWDEYKTTQSVAGSSAEAREQLQMMFKARGGGTIFLAAVGKFCEALSKQSSTKKHGRSLSPQKAAEYFFYAGTQNQLDSMITTINFLVRAGKSVKLVVPRLSRLQPRNVQISPEMLSFGNLAALGLSVSVLRRFRSLLTKSRQLSPIRSLQALDLLIQAHVSTASFTAALTIHNPKFVVVANDHNPDVLSLLEVARARGIWTCYLQHASVSGSYPALNFDISFLDGQKAFRDYQNCEHHVYDATSLLSRRYVVLSGMKKPLTPNSLVNRTRIGVALSSDTELHQNLMKLREVFPQGFNMTVRAHPGTHSSKKRQIREACDKHQMEFSDPSEEPIGAFLADVIAVIGGSSSVLLEAAIAGARSIYFEPFAGRYGDYYGFVNGGIATPCATWQDLLTLISESSRESKTPPKEAIRDFHASFETRWEGREGELVGKVLTIFDGTKPSIADIESDWIREISRP